MAEQELKPRGTVDPTKKPTWLKEVKLDAARNTIEHLRRQKESQEFEYAKARGLTVEDVVKKGRQDLGMPEPENTQEEVKPSGNAASDADLAELKKELQKERAARTRAENKLKAQEPQGGEAQADPKPETK